MKQRMSVSFVIASRVIVAVLILGGGDGSFLVCGD